MQFFIAPQFTENAVNREVMAVDSENTNNLQTDSRRLYQLEKFAFLISSDIFFFAIDLCRARRTTIESLERAIVRR